jgi:hypothetical protein
MACWQATCSRRTAQRTPSPTALAWRIGPAGKPIARGLDVLTIRDGLVSAVDTMIAAEPDV